MSKGHGKTQRAILTLIQYKHPEDAFTTVELASAVYGGPEHRVTKSHRVAIIRACRGLVKEGSLASAHVWSQGSEKLWFRKGSLRGEAVAKEKSVPRRPFSEERVSERVEAVRALQREREELGEEEFGYRRFKDQALGIFGLRFAIRRERDASRCDRYTRRFLRETYTALIAEKQEETETLSKEVDDLREKLTRLEDPAVQIEV